MVNRIISYHLFAINDQLVKEILAISSPQIAAQTVPYL